MPFWQLVSATSSRAESPIFDISFILLTNLISLLLLRVLLYGRRRHALPLSLFIADRGAVKPTLP